MRVLSVDPGAERCGWCVLDGPDPMTYNDSGILMCRRAKFPFQDYRLLLQQHTWWGFSSLVQNYTPDIIVNEIVPAVSSGTNFIVATQSYLVNTVVTTIHNVATFYNIPVTQLGATTVHSWIVAKTHRSSKSKVTKQQVRNGVLRYMPELKDKAAEWTRLKHWDESDACAIGITYLLINK